jgi:hypothetical protein
MARETRRVPGIVYQLVHEIHIEGLSTLDEGEQKALIQSQYVQPGDCQHDYTG